MLKIHFALLIVLSMILLGVQSMHIQESHEPLKGVDPVSGFTIEYMCYKSSCRATCTGLAPMWCYTNKKKTDGKKPCSSDRQCDGYFSKCVTACGI